MPSVVYDDLLLRTYEYNFWLYHYIARKFKIESEYGYEFGTQGEIVPAKAPRDPVRSSMQLIAVLYQVVVPDAETPFNSDGQEKIQRLIRAWYDYCVEEESRTHMDAFYPMTMYKDDVQWVADCPNDTKIIINYLYQYSADYGYYAYALPCGKKITDLSGCNKQISLFQALDRVTAKKDKDAKDSEAAKSDKKSTKKRRAAAKKNLYNQWLQGYLTQHQGDYFFLHDFMSNYRTNGQPGHDQIRTKSKEALNYIWYKRNFKYGCLDEGNEEYYAKDYRRWLDIFRLTTEENIDKRYAYILFLIDEKHFNLDKTLNSIDRIVDSMQEDSKKERVSIKYVTVDGKPTADRSKVFQEANSKQLVVFVGLSEPAFAVNTTKKKIHEIYLKAISNIAPDETQEILKARAMLLHSTYCCEDFRAQSSIRMAALLIWDALYFNIESFQQKTKPELDKIVSDLISGKIYIDANSSITANRDEAFIDLAHYVGGHLRFAFKQTCLSIAQGAVLPTAIKNKK